MLGKSVQLIWSYASTEWDFHVLAPSLELPPCSPPLMGREVGGGSVLPRSGPENCSTHCQHPLPESALPGGQPRPRRRGATGLGSSRDPDGSLLRSRCERAGVGPGSGRGPAGVGLGAGWAGVRRAASPGVGMLHCAPAAHTGVLGGRGGGETRFSQ